MATDDKTYVTAETLQEIKKDLEFLKKVKRPEILDQIKTAKEHGDLSENAEYHAAREAQMFNEAKIRELEYKVKNAVIFKEAKTESGVVRVGSTIKVKSEFGEDNYTIVGSHESKPAEGKISNESPLGNAFIGKKKGDKVNVPCPNGTCEYEILEVK